LLAHMGFSVKPDSLRFAHAGAVLTINPFMLLAFRSAHERKWLSKGYQINYPITMKGVLLIGALNGVLIVALFLRLITPLLGDALAWIICVSSVFETIRRWLRDEQTLKIGDGGQN